MSNDNKATIREVVNMLDPIKKDVTEIKTLLTEHLKNYKEDCRINREEHRGFISGKAFTAWLSALGVIVAVITTILFMR